MSKSVPPFTNDGFRPSDAFDVSDENPKVIAEHLRALQREMRSGFELLANRILPELAAIREAIEDVKVRVRRLEGDRDDHDQRLRALEAQAKTKRARRRK